MDRPRFAAIWSARKELAGWSRIAAVSLAMRASVPRCGPAIARW
ncbi:hypothetical protein [Nocardia mangyaensis]|nr:hypothetical protein [Nocardia mangyaensis]MDO3647706.1 hypothetical protein [Nocardia mangyaensis]